MCIMHNATAQFQNEAVLLAFVMMLIGRVLSHDHMGSGDCVAVLEPCVPITLRQD
jgi:hypothetical protein